ncbi:DDX17 [Cordylochernes scorpioides]|uniref:RNA helicase n=1 Tax=Cordylochernes scorpioides TaxID=51811 RepID=A0ABY6L0A7_9ARAC|nr:DDX17 [Cordylochernes scorpioides]
MNLENYKSPPEYSPQPSISPSSFPSNPFGSASQPGSQTTPLDLKREDDDCSRRPLLNQQLVEKTHQEVCSIKHEQNYLEDLLNSLRKDGPSDEVRVLRDYHHHHPKTSIPRNYVYDHYSFTERYFQSRSLSGLDRREVIQYGRKKVIEDKIIFQKSLPYGDHLPGSSTSRGNLDESGFDNWGIQRRYVSKGSTDSLKIPSGNVHCIAAVRTKFWDDPRSNVFGKHNSSCSFRDHPAMVVKKECENDYQERETTFRNQDLSRSRLEEHYLPERDYFWESGASTIRHFDEKQNFEDRSTAFRGGNEFESPALSTGQPCRNQAPLKNISGDLIKLERDILGNSELTRRGTYRNNFPERKKFESWAYWVDESEDSEMVVEERNLILLSRKRGSGNLFLKDEGSFAYQDPVRRNDSRGFSQGTSTLNHWDIPGNSGVEKWSKLETDYEGKESKCPLASGKESCDLELKEEEGMEVSDGEIAEELQVDPETQDFSKDEMITNFDDGSLTTEFPLKSLKRKFPESCQHSPEEMFNPIPSCSYTVCPSPPVSQPDDDQSEPEWLIQTGSTTQWQVDLAPKEMAVSDMRNRRHVQLLLTWSTNAAHPDELYDFVRTNQITFKGQDIPMPVLSFNDIEFPDFVKMAILQQNYAAPTPIQSLSWPIALEGRNMVGIAQTGSGKTFGWCRERSSWNCSDWGRIVFSDEPCFLLCPDDRRKYVWRCSGQGVEPGHTFKHETVPQQGVMVWGAISFDSRTPLVVIPGTLTAQRYVHDILRPVLLLFLSHHLGLTFQQDNARPHTTHVTMDCLQSCRTFRWPAKSPDISPIEHI